MKDDLDEEDKDRYLALMSCTLLRRRRPCVNDRLIGYFFLMHALGLIK